MNTRELEKGTSIVTALDQRSPLSYDELLTFPDLRLKIGSRIPIPFEMDPLISYGSDNTFGRKKQRYCDILLPPDGETRPCWCEYCSCPAMKLTKHSKTNKCQTAQRKLIVLPRLTNVRTNLLDQNRLIGDEFDATVLSNLPPSAIEWMECFDVMSQLAVKGLPIDFGLSDFLLTNTSVPLELKGYCALQTRTGSFLEGLLLSVSGWS